MVFADFDYDDFPIVTINFYEKPCDKEEFKEYIQEFTALLSCASKNDSKCCIVFDCSDLQEKIPLSYAKVKAEFLQKNKELLESGLSASCVIGPKWIGTILDIIFTIHPPTRPYKFSNDIDIGKEFIENYKTIPLETIDKDMIIDYLDVQ